MGPEMPVGVYIPTPFRRHTGGQARVEVEASSVEELLREVVRRFPELGRHIFDGEGRLLEYLNVYVNEEEIRTLEGLGTSLKEGDEVAIVPAMAGGRGAICFRVAGIR